MSSRHDSCLVPEDALWPPDSIHQVTVVASLTPLTHPCNDNQGQSNGVEERGMEEQEGGVEDLEHIRGGEHCFAKQAIPEENDDLVGPLGGPNPEDIEYLELESSSHLERVSNEW